MSSQPSPLEPWEDLWLSQHRDLTRVTEAERASEDRVPRRDLPSIDQHLQTAEVRVQPLSGYLSQCQGHC